MCSTPEGLGLLYIDAAFPANSSLAFPSSSCAVDPCPTHNVQYFQMIFKSPSVNNLLFQGFHIHCVDPPSDLTSSSQLEGIEDILPSDVDVIKRWITDGAAKSGKVRNVQKNERGGYDGGGYRANRHGSNI